MIRIYYFSPYDILRPRTNQISDVRLCEGFAENNYNVELIFPYVYRKDNLKKGEIFDCYGVKTPYKLTMLKTPFWNNIPRTIMVSLMFLYNFFVIFRILLCNIASLTDVVIMSRSVDLLIPVILLKKLLQLFEGPKVISWAHELKFKKRYLWVYRNVNGIAATNSAVINDLYEKLQIPSEKLAVSLNPITENQLRNIIDREDARKKLNLNVNDRPLVVYTGKLYIGQKEAEYILKAAHQLPDYNFLLTGGKPHVVEYYDKWCRERKISNVLFTGYLYDYNKIKYYQFVADVLVSYYTQRDHLVKYNLPQKIAEYMLTHNAIVTPDYPATRDILNDSNAIFVKPENLGSLIQGIRHAVENKEYSNRKARQAFQDVQEMTFKKRTKILLDFFKTCN